jgi:hypothetical protein
MTIVGERVAERIEAKLGISLEPSGGWDEATDAQLRERFGLDRYGVHYDAYQEAWVLSDNDPKSLRVLHDYTTEAEARAAAAEMNTRLRVEGEDTVDDLERRGVLTATEVAWLRDAD